MIPIAMPVLEKAEADAAHQAVLSGWVSQGLLAIHQMGMPCDLPALTAVASRHIALIEDAACAVGSEIRMNGQWERIGRPHDRLPSFPSTLAKSSPLARVAC